MKTMFAAALAASVMALTGCASMDRQSASTVGGAAIGGVVGGAVAGTPGAVAGAVGGAVVGNEMGKR